MVTSFLTVPNEGCKCSRTKKRLIVSNSLMGWEGFRICECRWLLVILIYSNKSVHKILSWFYHGRKFSIIRVEKFSGNPDNLCALSKHRKYQEYLWPGNQCDRSILSNYNMSNVSYYFFQIRKKTMAFVWKWLIKSRHSCLKPSQIPYFL